MTDAIRQRTRSLGLLATVVVAVLALGACNSAAADQDFAMINSLRANHGLAQLSRSGELNTKAQAQADRMANRGRIYHSTDLAAGVSPGWQLIGENVAVAGSIEQAQSALEASPGRGRTRGSLPARRGRARHAGCRSVDSAQRPR